MLKWTWISSLKVQCWIVFWTTLQNSDQSPNPRHQNENFLIVFFPFLSIESALEQTKEGKSNRKWIEDLCLMWDLSTQKLFASFSPIVFIAIMPFIICQTDLLNDFYVNDKVNLAFLHGEVVEKIKQYDLSWWKAYQVEHQKLAKQFVLFTFSGRKKGKKIFYLIKGFEGVRSGYLEAWKEDFPAQVDKIHKHSANKFSKVSNRVVFKSRKP